MASTMSSKLRSGEQGLRVTQRPRYEVWSSDFHGGKLRSKHRSARAAVRAQRAAQLTDCVCGCAYILDAQTGYRVDPRDLPLRGQS